MDEPVPTFATEQEAYDWMDEQVDDVNTDNHRLAYEDDPASIAAYEKAAAEGCCGDFDAAVIIAGRPAVIGCNYGH